MISYTERVMQIGELAIEEARTEWDLMQHQYLINSRIRELVSDADGHVNDLRDMREHELELERRLNVIRCRKMELIPLVEDDSTWAAAP